MIAQPSETVPVATLANLGAAFTEQTTEVWCDFFDQPAQTNHDGGAHFCQFCGSTEHAPLLGRRFETVGS